jgi:hypothetical protein
MCEDIAELSVLSHQIQQTVDLSGGRHRTGSGP